MTLPANTFTDTWDKENWGLVFRDENGNIIEDRETESHAEQEMPPASPESEQALPKMFA